MSAWIVSKRHIDAIVTALMQAGLVPATQASADAYGDMLWRENIASVAYRYRHAPADCYYQWEHHALNDQWMRLKQLDCYDYQSCEHPGWEASEAHRLTEALRAHTLAALNVGRARYQQAERYDKAPWGIN